MSGKQAARILKGARGKPVLVHWMDAQAHVEMWMSDEDLDLNANCQVVTAGIYLGLGGKQVWLSQASFTDLSYHSVPFAIPLGCVSMIRVLK